MNDINEYWERFCRTGAIADYLAYRGAPGFCGMLPDEGTEDDDADSDRRFGDPGAQY